MSEKRVFLDEQHDVVPREKASWLVIHKYDGKGKLEKEVWVDLKATV